MNHSNNHAISPIVGTILLLLMVLASMSVIYFNVLSDQGPADQKFVTVIGSIEGTSMVIEHQGGENLPISDIHLKINFLGESLQVDLDADLPPEAIADGYWGLGERLIIPFPLENITKEDYENIDAEILAIDRQENSIAFIGTLSLDVVSDISVDIIVNNTTPKKHEMVLFTVSVTNPDGIVDARNVSIYFKLPDSFSNISYYAEQGSYDKNTGIWTIGDTTLNQDPIKLEVTTTFQGTTQQYEFTQLCILVDGSGSVKNVDWNIMRTGLSNAIKDPTVFPNDGIVELSIIQFAQNGAFLELGPTIITAANANAFAQSVQNLHQRNGGTPLSAALKLAADTMYNSPSFDTDHRQIVNIVTDGMPNRQCSDVPGVYTGPSVNYNKGKADAVKWREYMISLCSMDEDEDETDSLAVGKMSGYYASGPDTDWINSSIIWPSPGCIAPPFDSGRSWVREVESWEQFYNATKEMFRIIFQGVWLTSEVYDSYPIDPNELNDRTQVLIVPSP